MKISLQRISTKELATLSERVILVSNDEKYAIVEEHPLLVQLINQYQNYKEVYAKLTYSGRGKEVAEADKQRDDAYNAIRNYVKHYVPMKLLPHYDKAEQLYMIFEQFGKNIPTLNYAEQTAQMEKLIEELSKTENKEILNHLGLTSSFEDLKTKQKNFENLYIQQTKANAELRQIPSATSIRKSLEKSLKLYLDFITVMKSVPNYSALYNDLNEIVKNIK